MSRLEVPLLGKRVWATGDILLRAELDLLIRDDNGVLRPETFRVDSGAEMTSMAAARAKALDLPMPRNAVMLHINGIRREVRPGLIRAQVVGMDATEYVLPCYFLGSPDAAADPHQPPVLARNLLGLTGLVDKLRISFDGTPSAGARRGIMVVERI
jgi:hypothetical protein